jgi:enoyl-CoA hydratase
MDEIVFNREKHLGLITLTRVQALNALTLPMILALQEQLQLWESDNGIHAIVIQAAPGKAFCAGGDVRWLYDAGKNNDATRQMEFFWNEYRLNHLIHRLTKPYIALMDGITMGGGVGISLHGSHPVASEKFVFAMPETSIGFFPDIGASYLLSRCPGNFGKYLGLTGNRLNAEEAMSLGLVKYLIPSTDFDKVLNQLLFADLSTNAHEAVHACLRAYNSVHTLLAISHQREIEDAFAFERVEDIMSFIERKDDRWHQDMLRNLQEKSPISLKVTLEQLIRAKSKSMAECIATDYVLVAHFMQEPDFYEGVRALLIDKDKTPKWFPAALQDVTETMVDRYFNRTSSPLNL